MNMNFHQAVGRVLPQGVAAGDRIHTSQEWYSQDVDPVSVGSTYVAQIEPNAVLCCALCGRTNLTSLHHFKSPATNPRTSIRCDYDCLCRVALGMIVIYKRELDIWNVNRVGPPPVFRVMTTAMWRVLLHYVHNLRQDLIRYQKTDWLPDQPYHQDTLQRDPHGNPIANNHWTIVQMYDHISAVEPQWTRDLSNYYVDDIPNFRQRAQQYPPYLSQHEFEQREQLRNQQRVADGTNKLQQDRDDRRQNLQTLVNNATTQTNQFFNHGGATAQWQAILTNNMQLTIIINMYMNNNP